MLSRQKDSIQSKTSSQSQKGSRNPQSGQRSDWNSESRRNFFKMDSMGRQPSKITTETFNTTGEGFQDLGELSSLKEQSVTQLETAHAKQRIHKLHGKNFGRSLTLEEMDQLSLKFNKKVIFAVLLLIVLIIFGVLYNQRQDNQRENYKPKIGKIGKNKNRRGR